MWHKIDRMLAEEIQRYWIPRQKQLDILNEQSKKKNDTQGKCPV